MALALWSMTTATKDYGFAECGYKQYKFWKVRETRKECSQSFDMTMLLRNVNKEDEIEICKLVG
jgi:hypothetical protein